jgi:hypothetical protein
LAELALDVRGIRAVFLGDEDAVSELGVHFAAFVTAPGGGRADIQVELVRGAPTLDVPERMVADQVVDRGVVYNRGSVTWVDHFGHATTRFDFDEERGRIVAPRVEDLVELGYLALHSRLGAHLERRGFFRLHCLGLVVGGRAGLVLAPSGGGKSRLALAALTRTRAQLLGDDVVLVDSEGRVHGFHSPIGVSGPETGAALGTVRAFPRRLHPAKWMVELAGLETRLARGPVDPVLVAIARRVTTGPSALAPASAAEIRAALFRDLVVGLGVPQVIELVARRGARDLAGLAPTALRRARAALALARRVDGRFLDVGAPEEAAELVVEALSR